MNGSEFLLHSIVNFIQFAIYFTIRESTKYIRAKKTERILENALEFPRRLIV